MKEMVTVLKVDGLSITEIYKMSVKEFMFTMELFFGEKEQKVEEGLTEDFLSLF